MRKLYRIHFTTIAVIDLLLFAFFSKRPETSLEWLLLSGLFSSLLKDSCYFAWLSDSNINSLRFILKSSKKIRFYYLGILSIDFLFFVLLTFVSSQRFLSLMPIITACHSTLYYMTADYLRENYPDFYDKHVSLWECL